MADLLRWTRNFSQPVVGDAQFVKELQTPGRFNDGRPHGYALGLTIGTYQGLREVAHSGATAGYRAWLSEYPERQVAVAVLCNVSSGNATQYAHAVADLYLGIDQAGRDVTNRQRSTRRGRRDRRTRRRWSRLSGCTGAATPASRSRSRAPAAICASKADRN